jgi:hypothetical protein
VYGIECMWSSDCRELCLVLFERLGLCKISMRRSLPDRVVKVNITDLRRSIVFTIRVVYLLLRYWKASRSD